MIFRAKAAKLIGLVWLNSNKKVAKLVSKTNLATLATLIGGVLTLYSGSSSTRRPPLTPFAPWAVSLLPTKQDSHRPLQLSDTQMSETQKSKTQKSEARARRFVGWFECRPMSEQRFYCHRYARKLLSNWAALRFEPGKVWVRSPMLLVPCRAP